MSLNLLVRPQEGLPWSQGNRCGLVGQLSFQGPALDMRSARCGDVGTQPGCSPHAEGTDPMMTAQDGVVQPWRITSEPQLLSQVGKCASLLERRLNPCELANIS